MAIRAWGAAGLYSERLMHLGVAVSVKKPALLAADWEGNEFLELAEASAGIGVWDMDLASGLVRGRPQFFRVGGSSAAGQQSSRLPAPGLAPN
jgi:hypothetical protein